MKRKHKGVLLLGLGILGLLGGMAVIFFGVTSFVKQFKSLARVQSPGVVAVTLEEAGVHTLWHDYRTNFKGSDVFHPPELPSGFNYTLVRELDGKVFPLDPTRSNATLSTPSRDAVAVGSFSPDLPGAYSLRVDHPQGEQRVFSLTQGSFLSGFGRFATSIVVSSIVGLLGLAMLVIGIVLMVTKPRQPAARQPPPPPPPPSFPG